jgi:3-isopropylmalate/(R)-2-methylmalate dehydratase small subunit
MPLKEIKTVNGACVVVAGDDIDTDRIIPARYMKCVTFDGLGEYLFYDVRFDEAGRPKAHPLNDPRYKNATILIGGRNFGCGSSREHAPQAVAKYGFRAIVAESFAEIFFGNSTTLGIPCVTATRADLNTIRERVAAHPEQEMKIDLILRTITFGVEVFPISIRESARDALIHGRWDAIGELLDAADLVARKAGTLPYFHTEAALSTHGT